MGSRIHIKFTELLQNPSIGIQFSSRKEGSGEDSFQNDVAFVEFRVLAPDGSHRAPPRVVVFDYTTFQGVVTLEKDFNYFRHEEQNSNVMRLLFDYHVCFTILH